MCVLDSRCRTALEAFTITLCLALFFRACVCCYENEDDAIGLYSSKGSWGKGVEIAVGTIGSWLLETIGREFCI